MKLWGGRFESGPSEVFERFSGSLRFDRRLLGADIRGSQAWARSLQHVGIIDSTECDRIVEALDRIGQEANFEGCSDEDIHTFVIRELHDKVGSLASKIHTGRSRNEQVSVDTRLWLRDACDRTRALILSVMQALLDLADHYPEAVIPGYTHLRRAQPVLWSHYLLAYFEMFARDWERFGDARTRANVLPLGSGALAGSGFPFDRNAIAQDLGFEAVTANSMDASSDRDFVLDFLYAASTTMLHLSRLAEDWILYSSEEFGWLELSDKVTSGSSLMPQKKNPDSLELIRGKTGSVIGSLTSLFIMMKGLPLTYNRDMQEDKEPIFTASDHLDSSLQMACTVVESVKLIPETPLAAVMESWVIATDLAEALARAGVPFHDAHQIVGSLVLESLRQGRRPTDWTADELSQFAPEFTAGIMAFLDPKIGMQSRNVPGGTSPQQVKIALNAARNRLQDFTALTVVRDIT